MNTKDLIAVRVHPAIEGDGLPDVSFPQFAAGMRPLPMGHELFPCRMPKCCPWGGFYGNDAVPMVQVHCLVPAAFCSPCPALPLLGCAVTVKKSSDWAFRGVPAFCARFR